MLDPADCLISHACNGNPTGPGLAGWLISCACAVNGNPTMLDLGGIPSILEIRANGTLELRDMLLKNVATEADLRAANHTALRPDFSRVAGGGA